MRHQLGEGENPELRRKRIANTSAQDENLAPDFVADDEIDPADFFDPEEFGFRRRGVNDARP